jgi:hypothetical protein
MGTGLYDGSNRHYFFPEIARRLRLTRALLTRSFGRIIQTTKQYGPLRSALIAEDLAGSPRLISVVPAHASPRMTIAKTAVSDKGFSMALSISGSSSTE